jgi:Ribosomal RNA adenine dimethylase
MSPTVMPSRSAIGLASASLYWVRLRVFTWSKEITGRPDDIVRLAGLTPGLTVVEIGSGTGQATRPLAEHHLRILALELDPRLADRARHNLGAFPALRISAGCGAGDYVPAGSSDAEQDPDPVVREASEPEADAIDPLDGVVDGLNGVVGKPGMVPGDGLVEPAQECSARERTSCGQDGSWRSRPSWSTRSRARAASLMS